MKAESHLELLFMQQVEGYGLPPPIRNYRKWWPGRAFELDFAWIEHRIGLEIQGAIWIKSKHTTGTGIMRDIDKSNAAIELGWRVVTAYDKLIISGVAALFIKRLLEGNPANGEVTCVNPLPQKSTKRKA